MATKSAKGPQSTSIKQHSADQRSYELRNLERLVSEFDAGMSYLTQDSQRQWERLVSESDDNPPDPHQQWHLTWR